MVGLGLLAAVGLGVADLVGRGRLPWPSGALHDPDVLMPTIAVLLCGLAYLVFHELSRVAVETARLYQDQD